MSEAPHESRPTFGVARLAEETRQRFVREIVARVPLARLVELHLFAPIRQGGMESGVAVLAALLEGSEEPAAAPAVPEVHAPVGPEAGAPPGDEPAETLPIEAARETVVDGPAEATPDAAAAERCDPTDAAAGPPPAGEEPEGDEAEATEEAGGAEPVAEDVVEATPVVLDADAVVALVAEPEPDAAASVAATAAPPPEPPRRRHTVFTARYRLVLKGPERGKWDVEVREEADAPLITVEAVVRGVQLRSGDAVESERLDAAAVARLVGQGAPAAGA